jgi:tetratricopeptide (TPR) repeat protein
MRGTLLIRALAVVLFVGSVPAACAQEPRSPAQAAATADEALRAGQYDRAIELARGAVARDRGDAAATRLLAKALRGTGKYAEAEAALAAFAGARPGDAALANLRGEIQRERGRLREAEASFREAVSGRAPDSLMAAVNLAVLRFDRGDIDGAMGDFDRFIDVYNTRRGRLTADELTAVAIACRYLGRDNPQLYKDALRAFDEAIRADSADLDRRVALAEMFLEKFASGEAQSTVQSVLAVNPRHARGLLVAAQVRHFDGQGDAAEYLRRSLEVNPASSEARAFSALLLIDLEQYADAAAEARRGLEADSTSPDALIALAAAQYLQNDTAAFRATMAKVHAREPGSAEAEATLSNVAARNRLYREAVEFADAAVARDPKASRALAYLGINALRIGDIQRGRELLERSFALDPYDVWAKNTLDLLDTFKDYDEVRTPRFVLMIEKKDAPLLSLYAQSLAEEAYDSLAARYGYRPAAPVRIEFYRSHADFSVRTVGLAGLGALGVSFGRVVAMDSPAARRTGEFNWGSTLWHELAHVFTLGASGNRVPRWVSEGLSVLEERRARPSWGDDPSPLFFAAYAAGQLPKVSRLNDGFMRPAYPEQIILSYYLASLVVEMIEADHGIAAIRAMLTGYGRGKTTEQLLREVLRTDPEAFDGRFDAWVKQRFARQLAVVTADAALGLNAAPGRGGRGGRGGNAPAGGEFGETLERGRRLLEEGKPDEAIEVLERAKAMFPEYAEEDGPYALLARAYEAKGAKAEAARELVALTRINEQAYEANRSAAAALEELGDLPGAIAALDRAIWISPFDPVLHERLATLASRAQDRRLAIRERRALLALDPTDRVEALYQLAVAYRDAGDVAAARREVLRALELAPAFEKAQTLLLSLQRPPERPEESP